MTKKRELARLQQIYSLIKPCTTDPNQSHPTYTTAQAERLELLEELMMSEVLNS